MTITTEKILNVDGDIFRINEAIIVVGVDGVEFTGRIIGIHGNYLVLDTSTSYCSSVKVIPYLITSKIKRVEFFNEKQAAGSPINGLTVAERGARWINKKLSKIM